MKLIDKKNKLYLLNDNNFDFPTLDMIKDDLVAVGGRYAKMWNHYTEAIDWKISGKAV